MTPMIAAGPQYATAQQPLHRWGPDARAAGPSLPTTVVAASAKIATGTVTKAPASSSDDGP